MPDLDHEDWSELDYALRDVGPIFARWLIAHNRKIAAKALREAANDMHRSWCQEDGPSDWLEDRADRIEQGDDQ